MENREGGIWRRERSKEVNDIEGCFMEEESKMEYQLIKFMILS